MLTRIFLSNQILAANRKEGEKGGFDWATRLKIVKGVARGLAYLHTQLSGTVDVPHGHLKSSNVLLDHNFEPLLMDYGLLPVTNKDLASELMVAFKSPEYRKHGLVSPKSDVWNLGMLILEILTGRFPSNYAAQGRAASTADLAQWVSWVVKEEWTGEVFDKEMVGGRRGELGEMLKLLQIGLACCEASTSKRWELEAAVEKIEEVSERGNMEEYSSYASDQEMYSSRAITDDDFSFSVAN